MIDRFLTHITDLSRSELLAVWRIIPGMLKLPLVIAGFFLFFWALALVMDSAREEYWGTSFDWATAEVESSMHAGFARPLQNGKAACGRYGDLLGVLLRFESDFGPEEFIEKTFESRAEQRPWPGSEVDRMFRLSHRTFVGWWNAPPRKTCVFYARMQGSPCQILMAGFRLPNGKLIVFVRAFAPEALRLEPVTEEGPACSVNIFASGGPAITSDK